MRPIKILLTILGVIPTVLNAQYCQRLKSNVFLDYNQKQLAWIKSNWTNFSFNPMDASLIANESLSQNADVYPIYLDAMGIPYDPSTFDSLQIERLASSNVKFKSFYKFSLYHSERLKRYTPSRKIKIKKTLNYNDAKNFYYQNFEPQLNNLRENLGSALNGKENLFFFCHGYNVPYSLAIVQFNNVLDSIAKLNPEFIEKTLFVPVFWPSNNQKENSIDPFQGVVEPNTTNREAIENSSSKMEYYKSSFSTKNDVYPFFGGLRNKKRFARYTKHAYMAGITIRQLLNDLPSEINSFVFTHSLGAISASVIGIDVKSPLQNTNKNYGDLFVDLYISQLDKINIPKQNLNFFMSAPAITGANTFADFDTLNSSVRENKYFVTKNIQDPILAKNMLPLLQRVGIAKATRFGATTFGLNYNGDVNNIESFFESVGLEEHFVSENVQVADHDIFMYLKNAHYIGLLSKFIEDEPKKPAVSQLFAKDLKLIEDQSILSNSKFTENSLFPKNFNQPGIHLMANHYNLSGIPLKDILVKIEQEDTTRAEGISLQSVQLINQISQPYTLILLENAIIDDSSGVDIQIKNDLIEYINLRSTELCKLMYPYYAYPTKNKRIAKFAKLTTANDLFMWPFSGIKKLKNYDMDYTGALNVKIATDFLSAYRRRPTLSYQTVEFGFDVWTPYFKDTTIFDSFDSFNPDDRPHASFIYVGWNKNGLSKYHNYRWTTKVRVGTIGGQIGEIFQTGLHQDISNSPEPKGWDAQISNGRRIGLDLGYKGEYNIVVFKKRDKKSFLKLNLQPGLELNMGTYMTYISPTLKIGNRNFLLQNADDIYYRYSLSSANIWQNLSWKIEYQPRFVVHNTMLEGYGIIGVMEENNYPSTPSSIHTVQDINSWVHILGLNLSYSSRYYSFFLLYNIKSPEANLGVINAGDDLLDLSKRWHKYATIGVSYNLR